MTSTDKTQMILPNGHASLLSGKVVDLTAITAPFGLLDEVYGAGTKAALKAHGGPYDFYGYRGWGLLPDDPSWTATSSYRVTPKPVVTTDVQYWSAGRSASVFQCLSDTHKITITMRDGKPDPVAQVEPLK